MSGRSRTCCTGPFTGSVDDLVLRRNDGVPAYNLAVVVDDAAQDVDQVVRGGDLLTSAPSQARLATLLGHDAPTYAHVPLALNPSGQRLAKRDGAVTRTELEARGVDVLALITESVGLVGATPTELLASFDPTRLPREPWTFVPPVGSAGEVLADQAGQNLRLFDGAGVPGPGNDLELGPVDTRCDHLGLGGHGRDIFGTDGDERASGDTADLVKNGKSLRDARTPHGACPPCCSSSAS